MEEEKKEVFETIGGCSSLCWALLQIYNRLEYVHMKSALGVEHLLIKSLRIGRVLKCISL